MYEEQGWERFLFECFWIICFHLRTMYWDIKNNHGFVIFPLVIERSNYLEWSGMGMARVVGGSRGRQGFPIWGSSMVAGDWDTEISSESSGGIYTTDMSEPQVVVSLLQALTHHFPFPFHQPGNPTLVHPNRFRHYWTGFDSDTL